MRRCWVSRGAHLLASLPGEQHSGNDRRCVKVGCFSFAKHLFSECNSLRSIMIGWICLSVLPLATLAKAESKHFGPRAGSKFSDSAQQYGRVSRRPYRRRQGSVRQSPEEASGNFDYRLETEDLQNTAPLETYDSSGSSIDQANFEPVGYCDCGDDSCCGDCVEPGCGCDQDYEPSCGCDQGCDLGYGCDDSYDPDCGCEDGCYTSTKSCRRTNWQAGFELSFVKPRFSENIAFTTMQGDGANNSTFSDTEFDYGLELTPRAWLEAAVNEHWSWRVTYWQFDHAPGTASTSPNANGFGEITHPAFGDVDISTTIPTDTFTASSRLNAYTIDMEALKQACLGGWQLGVGGGVRYASTEQNYFAQLRNTGNVLRGQIDSTHELEGFGPTISLSARRPLASRVKLVCAARGSLLYGDGSSRLVAGEDLDLANPFTTTRLTHREDLLPIGETRFGLEWMSPKKRRSFQWMLSTAMEGQFWGNAGQRLERDG